MAGKHIADMNFAGASRLSGLQPHQVLLLILFGAIASALSIRYVRVYRRLRHIPGPFWSRITDIQRALWVTTGRAHKIHQHLHSQYGEAVRFGPNMVSLSNPAWIPTVYPIRPGFIKSPFYRTLMAYSRNVGVLPAIFNTSDESLHKQIKSPIAPLFSISSAVRLEVFVDKTLHLMTEQIDRRFAGKPRAECDLSDWLQFFAFEVMGTLTFSKRYGFLEEGRDVDGMISRIWGFMRTSAPYTQIPWFDDFWNKTALMTSIKGTTPGMSILGFVGRIISERREARAKAQSKGQDTSAGERDLLSQYLELTEKNPSLPPWVVTAWTFSNVIAGSDSAAAVMKEIMYNLLAHPSTLAKLRSELLSVEELSKPYPAWKEVCDLPYLDACIQEGIRLHPPFCLPLERVVPDGGLEIGGRFYPGGSVVGMSPYVVNRHEPTFGDNVDEWDPERWMVPRELRKRREDSIMTFGAGRRVCLGRHIAKLELKKIISALVLRYDFELVDSSRFWRTCRWFFLQGGLDVTVKKRVEA